jgi:chromosome segregation ATPase
MQTNQGSVVNDTLPKRMDKALAWLERSRDTWKEKCRKTKLLLKRTTFTVKRIQEGRNTWRLSSIRLKQELYQSRETISALRQHIANLESQVDIFKNQATELKKKSSRPM